MKQVKKRAPVHRGRPSCWNYTRHIRAISLRNVRMLKCFFTGINFTLNLQPLNTPHRKHHMRNTKGYFILLRTNSVICSQNNHIHPYNRKRVFSENETARNANRTKLRSRRMDWRFPRHVRSSYTPWRTAWRTSCLQLRQAGVEPSRP